MLLHFRVKMGNLRHFGMYNWGKTLDGLEICTFRFLVLNGWCLQICPNISNEIRNMNRISDWPKVETGEPSCNGEFAHSGLERRFASHIGKTELLPWTHDSPSRFSSHLQQGKCPTHFEKSPMRAEQLCTQSLLVCERIDGNFTRKATKHSLRITMFDDQNKPNFFVFHVWDTSAILNQFHYLHFNDTAHSRGRSGHRAAWA